MRLVIQRVNEASVSVDGSIVGQIGIGLLLLLGIEIADSEEDKDWLVSKLIQLRIFSDDAGQMNLSVRDVKGDILLVSQFTLFASTKKGNRPSFIRAARPELALSMYHSFIQSLEFALGKPVAKGIFGADMQVSLVNNGPVTVIIDSKNRE